MSEALEVCPVHRSTASVRNPTSTSIRLPYYPPLLLDVQRKLITACLLHPMRLLEGASHACLLALDSCASKPLFHSRAL